MLGHRECPQLLQEQLVTPREGELTLTDLGLQRRDALLLTGAVLDREDRHGDALGTGPALEVVHHELLELVRLYAEVGDPVHLSVLEDPLDGLVRGHPRQIGRDHILDV